MTVPSFGQLNSSKPARIPLRKVERLTLLSYLHPASVMKLVPLALTPVCLSVVRTAASAGLLLHVLLSSPVIVEWSAADPPPAVVRCRNGILARGCDNDVITWRKSLCSFTLLTRRRVFFVRIVGCFLRVNYCATGLHSFIIVMSWAGR